MIRLTPLMLLLLASPAAAHGTLPGANGFAAGFVHPFVAVEHLLLLMGLGILIGRQFTRRPLIGLLMGLCAGFGAAMLAAAAILTVPLLPMILTLALVIGGLLAANCRLNGVTLISFSGLVGLVVGADTDGPGDASALIVYGGTLMGVMAIVLNAMAAAQFGAGRLNGIPLRVAGSWIAAAAVLILAFLLRQALEIA
jgi:urease accessory protein